MKTPTHERDTDSRFTVTVASGMHTGATVTLARGLYLVGSGDACDVVLSDPGIEPAHLEIYLRPSGSTLRCVGGAVTVRGRALAAGSRASVELPADIDIAGVRLSFADSDGDGLSAPAIVPFVRTRHSGRSRRIMIGAGGILALIAVATTSYFRVPGIAQSEAGAPAAIPALASLVESGLALAGMARPSEKPAPTPAQRPSASAAEALTQRLNAAGLSGFVTVREAGGVIEASGVVRPESESVWTAAQTWFDDTYRGRFALVPRVQIREGASAIPNFGIQAVLVGKASYVIATNGERYEQGARLPGGWQIDAIRKHEIVVSRNGERVSLTP